MMTSAAVSPAATATTPPTPPPSRAGGSTVKADFCTPQLPNGSVIKAEDAYPAFSRALNATGRPIYFLACFDHWLNKTSGGALPGFEVPWAWLQPWVNAYRLSTDHHDNWAEVQQQIDLSANSAEFSVAGSFGDWDALLTGGQGCLRAQPPPPPPPPLRPAVAARLRARDAKRDNCHGPGAVDCGPEGGGPAGVRCPNMTEVEYRTAFSIWVLGASPLMIDADIRNMSAFQRETLLHKGMLAIHSDPLARGGSRVGSCTPAAAAAAAAAAACQVWVKPLAGNHSAVALLNAAASPQRVGFSFALLGYNPKSDKLLVRDVWTGEAPRTYVGAFVSAKPVPPHGTMVLQVSQA